MAKGRWQHLDLRKPVPARPAGAEGEPDPVSQTAPERAETLGPETPVSPALQQARALYTLHQFEQCADLLTAALAVHPELPGGQKLLGLALGRLDCPAQAADHLHTALKTAPADSELRASFLSAEIRAGRLPAIREPRAAVRGTGSRSGSLGELLGAAHWLRGQEFLRLGRAADAGEAYREAGEWFTQHSPAEVLAERIAGSYVGEAVSQLLAGDLDAAQRAFSRLRERARLPETTLRFARGLYELAEALRELSPSERREEVTPLVEAVLGARLRVSFYDGSRPVEIYWENLP